VSCKGYYSYDVGNWHMVALNSNCPRVSCRDGDPQVQWLKADLAANSGKCTLAYFHHPLWTSGQVGVTPAVQPIYQVLYDNGADLILAGHDHAYERFAPMDPSGAVDPARGVRQIVVGTGGRNTTSFTRILNGSEVRNSTSFGVQRLVLHPRSYDWRFVPTGGSFSESGSQPCHIARGDDTTAPAAPANLTAAAGEDAHVDLTWGAAADNVGVVAYRIYRDGALLTTIGNLTGYTDSTVSPGAGYSYRVAAVDASGNESARSSAASVTAQAAPPGVIFADGFETGSMSAWSATNAIVAQEGAGFAGSWGARATSTGAVTHAYWGLPTAQPDVYYRIRFRVIAQAGNVTLLKLRNSSSQTVMDAYISSSSGLLTLRNTITGASFRTTAVPERGVWHKLQVHLRTGTSGVLEAWLDGNQVATFPGGYGTAPISRIQLGDNTAGTAYDVAFDDVVLGTQRLP
jgi:chitodextrinase